MDHYQNLYQRNGPIIAKDTQKKVARLKIGVAGCGSTGGAFIDGALRLGVQAFRLTDSGSYELNNLNRQMMTLSDIGQNKSISRWKPLYL